MYDIAIEMDQYNNKNTSWIDFFSIYTTVKMFGVSIFSKSN